MYKIFDTVLTIKIRVFPGHNVSRVFEFFFGFWGVYILTQVESYGPNDMPLESPYNMGEKMPPGYFGQFYT